MLLLCTLKSSCQNTIKVPESESSDERGTHFKLLGVQDEVFSQWGIKEPCHLLVFGPLGSGLQSICLSVNIRAVFASFTDQLFEHVLFCQDLSLTHSQ